QRAFDIKTGSYALMNNHLSWPPMVTLGRLLPRARDLGFKPRRGGFPSEAKKEWGLSSKTNVRVLHTTQLDVTRKKPVRIIPGSVGIVQLAKIRKQSDIHRGRDDSVLSTQEYMKQVAEDVGEDEDFNSGSWVGATEYVKANGGIVSGCIRDIKTFLKNAKLEQVVAIIKSCSSNALGDLKVTVKDLFEEEIVKLVEEEEMDDLELHVCGNVIDQEDLYKFYEEALDFLLEEEARELRAHEEWLEKCRQQKEEEAKHERQLLGFHGTI
nr:hypothetical protein [Tanacetum cinerariifolium]